MSRDVEKPFWDHAAEFVDRLKVIALTVFISSTVIALFPTNIDEILTMDFFSFNFNYTPMVSWFLKEVESQLLPPDVILIAGGWLDTIAVFFVAAISLGIIASSPIMAYETYKFVSPALYPHEKTFILIFTFAFVGLFAAGMIYAYYLILPMTFRVLLYFTYLSGAEPYFGIWDFFYFTFLALITSGIFFTIPLFLSLLIKFGLLEVETLEKNKKTVFLVILIITAILTPDPSPISMLLLCIPFFALYQASIYVGSRISRRRLFEEEAMTPDLG